jgi:hypothetical protein
MSSTSLRPSSGTSGRGDVRRDRLRIGERIDVGERRVDAGRRHQLQHVIVGRGARCDARSDRLHAGRGDAAIGKRLQQRHRDARLADPGVGAGDEDAARRAHRPRPPAGSKRTIGRPSAVRLGSPFQACP